MFVIDSNKEELAIKEANVLGIPVVAILDSNSNPNGIAFPVPGNDDASRAIRLYCDSVAQAIGEGRAAAGLRQAGPISARWSSRRSKLRSTPKSSSLPFAGGDRGVGLLFRSAVPHIRTPSPSREREGGQEGRKIWLRSRPQASRNCANARAPA